MERHRGEMDRDEEEIEGVRGRDGERGDGDE